MRKSITTRYFYSTAFLLVLSLIHIYVLIQNAHTNGSAQRPQAPVCAKARQTAEKERRDMDSQTQKLLGAVVKNTQMCQTTLNKLIGITKDAELKKKIHEQLATHEDISNRARAMLAADGCEVKPESAMAKMSAQMGIAMKTMRDASSRNLAQMMIEGNHMGVTDLTMAIKEAENANPGAVALAQRLQHCLLYTSRTGHHDVGNAAGRRLPQPPGPH